MGWSLYRIDAGRQLFVMEALVILVCFVVVCLCLCFPESLRSFVCGEANAAKLF